MGKLPRTWPDSRRKLLSGVIALTAIGTSAWSSASASSGAHSANSLPSVPAATLKVLEQGQPIPVYAVARAHPAVSLETATNIATKAPWPGTAMAATLVNYSEPITSGNTHLAWLIEIRPFSEQFAPSAGVSVPGRPSHRQRENYFTVTIDAVTGRFLTGAAGFDPSLGGPDGAIPES